MEPHPHLSDVLIHIQLSTLVYSQGIHYLIHLLVQSLHMATLNPSVHVPMKMLILISFYFQFNCFIINDRVYSTL